MTIELSRGTEINNRYLIQRVLGQGGCGRTYLALDRQRFDEPCVLKEFFPSATTIQGVQKSRELFIREARILYQLQHPQIPKFLGWFEENGRLFLVQEYVDGKTYAELLEERDKRGQTFSEAEVSQWLLDMLPVLDYIHKRGIVHRDIAPDNVMRPKGKYGPKLIDFGVVKEVAIQLQAKERGTVVGKQGYSPPEQMLAGQCFPSSDLYALAVTALVLLSGKAPNEFFDDRTLKLKWHNSIRVSDRLARILEKMLDHIPQKRYQSAKEVLEILNPPPKPSVWKPIALSIATGFLAVLGVGSAIRVSPYIEPVCQVLNNCDPNMGFKTLYNLALGEGNEALVLFGNAKNAADLETARDRLEAAISQLDAIPSEAAIYPEVKNVLSNYRDRQKDINSRVQSEREAAQQFAEAKQNAEDGINTALAPQSLEQLRSSRDRLKDAVSSLEKIKKETFAYPEARKALAKYQPDLQLVKARVEIEQQALDKLERAKKNAGGAIEREGSARQAQDLERVRDRFNQVIAELGTIKASTLAYPDARELLASYRQRRQAIEARIPAEQGAERSLEEAEAIARDAERLTKRARTLAQLERANGKWQEAIDKLKTIPDDALIADKVKSKLEDYQSEVKKIAAKIASFQQEQNF